MSTGIIFGAEYLDVVYWHSDFVIAFIASLLRKCRVVRMAKQRTQGFLSWISVRVRNVVAAHHFPVARIVGYGPIGS